MVDNNELHALDGLHFVVGVVKTIGTLFHIVMADRNCADGCIYKIAFRKQNLIKSVYSYHDNF